MNLDRKNACQEDRAFAHTVIPVWLSVFQNAHGEEPGIQIPKSLGINMFLKCDQSVFGHYYTV